MKALFVASLLTGTLLAAPVFAQQAPAQTEMPAQAQPETQTQEQQQMPAAAPAGSADFLASQEQDHLLADDLMGASVTNPQDEDVGTVEDLIFDKNWKLSGVVLSVGGFLGMGAKEVAIPVEGYEVIAGQEPDQHVIRVQYTKEQLEQAPEFKTLADIRQEEEAARQQAAPPAGTAPAPAP